MPRTLALFDLDGTLTEKDTLLEFIRYVHGEGGFLSGMARNLPWLAAYKLHLIPNWKAKEKVLKHFFGGMSAEEFKEKASAFGMTVLPELIRKDTLEKLRQHERDGAVIAVVTASVEAWVKPWTETMKIHCIASDLEVVSGAITGRIIPANCYGPEKERRVRAHFNLNEFERIFAYGNSRGDRELLAMANEGFHIR
ncbi:MAG: HAD-IB family hydrolase [Flavobacteriales bacterium]|nr:HAD-IB family hydrolase [Flavobacteriales bacterium]